MKKRQIKSIARHIVFAISVPIPVVAAGGLSCNQIHELESIERMSEAFLSGLPPEIGSSVIRQITQLAAPRSDTPSESAGFLSTYRASRARVGPLYREGGSASASAYMRTDSYRELGRILSALEASMDCNALTGRTVLFDGAKPSQNYEISSGGHTADDHNVEEAPTPTRPEKIGLAGAVLDRLGIAALITSLIGAVGAFHFFLKRHRSGRRDHRYSCELSVLLATDGDIAESTLFDVSRSGCKLMTDMEIGPGDTVRVQWGQEWVQGTCVWSNQFFAGINFDSSLTRSELDLVLSLNRSSPPEEASGLSAPDHIAAATDVSVPDAAQSVIRPVEIAHTDAGGPSGRFPTGGPPIETSFMTLVSKSDEETI